jgi:pyruvate formate lyase activating enzyme
MPLVIWFRNYLGECEMEAYLYESLDNGKVRCHLCRHRCLIKAGKKGICQVRENRDGILNSNVYGRVIAQHIDPIEKKPIFHLMPGSKSYSIATVGCNFKCLFCQNADIAQMPATKAGMIVGERLAPQDIVQKAVASGCQSIAYTYTEPTVYFEFALDTAKLASENGIRNVFVTNGYMTDEALNMIHPYLDAANVDLKGFTDEFYRKYCGAHLSNVKETLKTMKQLGILVEVTTLLIPGLNDDEKELAGLAQFIAESLGAETPWHISRFHPTFKLTDRPPTPVETLVHARRIGVKTGLKYVYTGNVPGENGEKTFCYSCGKMLIDRWGFYVRSNGIRDGCCPDCGVKIDGIGM